MATVWATHCAVLGEWVHVPFPLWLWTCTGGELKQADHLGSPHT